MREESYNISEAYEFLKDHLRVVDGNNSIFYLHNKMIHVKGKNSSYSLTRDDYFKLYEKSKFYLYEDKDEGIDVLKDIEYYKDFKHK